MESRSDQPESRWLRFTLRRMLVCVFLICSYAGLWHLTATRGANDVIRKVWGDEDMVELSEWGVETWTPAPFVVRLTSPQPVSLSGIVITRRYYLWYGFGTVKFPLQAKDPPSPEVG